MHDPALNFGELRHREVRRIHILRTWVNRSGLPYLRAKHSGYVVPCKLVTVGGSPPVVVHAPVLVQHRRVAYEVRPKRLQVAEPSLPLNNKACVTQVRELVVALEPWELRALLLDPLLVIQGVVGALEGVVHVHDLKNESALFRGPSKREEST